MCVDLRIQYIFDVILLVYHNIYTRSESLIDRSVQIHGFADLCLLQIHDTYGSLGCLYCHISIYNQYTLFT